jgi:hypothetical protein
MATLEGRSPKETYGNLLQVDNANVGIDATLRAVSDGEGTSSILDLSTTDARFRGNVEITGNLQYGNLIFSSFTAVNLTVTGTADFSTATVLIGTISSIDVDGGTINGTTIGASAPAAGTFTSVTATTADIDGGTLDGVTIGASAPGLGTFTTLTATGNVSGVDGTFTGNVSGATATFTGPLVATTGTFSGSVDGASATFSGTLVATGGSPVLDIATLVYSLPAAANGRFVRFTGVSTISVTIPLGALATGYETFLSLYATGPVQITGATGVTILNGDIATAPYSIATIYKSAFLKQVATDIWHIEGSIT